MRSKRKQREHLENFLFTIPAVILVCIVMYIPFVMSGYYSLTEWNGIAKEPVFIGLRNFKDIFGGKVEFISALWFTVRYTLLFVVLSNVLALALAVALTKKFPLVNVYRSLFFIPYIMSMTIVGFIWKFIFTSGFKALASLSLGFYIVLYIAGLQAVPREVLEAATVDGATSRQSFFRVTLPLLGPSMTTCIFMSLTNGLKVFDIILALTKGGPGTSTYSATLQIYNDAFTKNMYGLGSAEAMLYFFAVLLITQIVLRVMSRKERRSNCNGKEKKTQYDYPGGSAYHHLADLYLSGFPDVPEFLQAVRGSGFGSDRAAQGTDTGELYLCDQ